MTEAPGEDSGRAAAFTWRPPEDDPKYVPWDAPFFQVPIRERVTTGGFWLAVILAGSGAFLIGAPFITWVHDSFGPASSAQSGWHVATNTWVSVLVTLLPLEGIALCLCGLLFITNPTRSSRMKNTVVCVAGFTMVSLFVILLTLMTSDPYAFSGLEAQFGPRQTVSIGPWFGFAASLLAFGSAIALRRTSPKPGVTTEHIFVVVADPNQPE
jgi:hypothetical protein